MTLALPLGMMLASGCGWVDSTGATDPQLVAEYQQLLGVNDIVDLVSEEPTRLDTSRLLLQNRETPDTGSNAATPATLVNFRQVGNSDTSNCPHLQATENTDRALGVSLLESCDAERYSNNLSVQNALDNQFPDETPTANTDAQSNPQCQLHFVAVEDEPGVYEVHTPAITGPVVLHYEVTASSASGSTSSPLTICLQP